VRTIQISFRWRGWVQVAICLLWAIGAAAKPEAEFQLEDGQQVWLADRESIRIGVMADYPPLHFTDRHGNPVGFGVDLLEEMNVWLGGKIHLESGTSSELMTRLKAGELDAVMDATPGGGDDDVLTYTQAYLDVPVVFVARMGGSRFFRNEKQLTGTSVAVEKGRPEARWLEQKQSRARIRTYDHASAALDAVSRGDSVVFMGNRAVALYLLAREMLSNLHVQGRNDDVPSALCIGVRKELPELAGILDRALGDALQHHGRYLRAKWFSMAVETGGRFEVGSAEKEWLAGNPRIRMGVPTDMPPMSFVDLSGDVRGLGVDFVEYANERLDGRIEWVTGLRAQLEKEFRAGNLEAILDASPTQAETGMLCTKPYANIPNVMVSRKGEGHFVGLDSLSNRTVAVVSGFPAAAHLKKNRHGLRLKEYPNVRNALEAVSTHQADAFVGGRAMAVWTLSHEMYMDLQVQGTVWEIESVSCMGVRADLPLLASVLNAAMASMPVAAVQAVFERWGGETWNQMTELSWVQLTPEEKEWLEKNPVIRVGSNPHLAPLEFTDSSGGFAGIGYDYLDRFGHALGVTFQHVAIPSWRQAQAKLRDGEVDMLSSLNRASAKQLEIEFSAPYQALPSAIFTHENTKPVANISELKDLRVAVLVGYGMDTQLQQRVPGLNVSTVYDAPRALQQLEAGELDAFVAPLLVGSYYIQLGGHSRIKVAGDFDFVFQPAFAVRSDTKILAQILTKAMEGIDEEEKITMARRWMTVVYDQRIDYAKLYKYVAGIAALLGLFTYWNRRMAAEIRRRRIVEASLLKSEEALVGANKELEAFSYSVSHDLRAPLRHVSGFVQLLQGNAKGKLDETGFRYLDVIAGAAKRMGTLIDDLLSFSRTGRAQINVEPIPLAEMVEECKKELELEMKGRSIEWTIGELPQVHADRPLLRQVMANLLGNAVKYSGKREVARIDISAKTEGNEIIVCVRDNGAGFDMKYANKLFGVFSRLHGESEFEGTGIGLANVRRIVLRHGGRTWAEGEVDKGASFYFSLPMNFAKSEKEASP